MTARGRRMDAPASLSPLHLPTHCIKEKKEERKELSPPQARAFSPIRKQFSVITEFAILGCSRRFVS